MKPTILIKACILTSLCYFFPTQTSEVKEKERLGFKLTTPADMHPYMAANWFDNSETQERFKRSITISDIFPITACTANPLHNNLYIFFLSYCDIPFEQRLYLLKGTTLELNPYVKNLEEAKELWETYSRACAIASKFQDPEALVLTSHNEDIFNQIKNPIPRVTINHAYKKVYENQNYPAALSMLSDLIEESISAYLEGCINTTIGNNAKIKKTISLFKERLIALQNSDFMDKSFEMQANLFQRMRDEGVEPLRICCAKEEDDDLAQADEFLKKCEDLLNLLMGERLEAFHVAREGLFAKKPSNAIAVLEALDKYFTHLPGVPQEKHFKSFYSRLYDAGRKTDKYHAVQLYRQSNYCARKLFYMQGDAATSDDLFLAYARFRNASLSCGKKTKEGKEFMEAAQYYLQRGEQALALENAGFETAEELKEAIENNEKKAAENRVSKLPALKDLYYDRGLSLLNKKVGPNEVVPVDDCLWLSKLWYLRAQSTPFIKNKREYYQKALSYLANNIGEDNESADLYKIGATAYFIIALKSYTKKTHKEVASFKEIEKQLFKQNENLAYMDQDRAISLETNYFVFGSKTRQEYLNQATVYVMKLIKTLPNNLYSIPSFDFALLVIEEALKNMDKKNSLYEKCLTNRMQYVAQKITLLGISANSDDFENAREILLDIATKTSRQKFKGKALARAIDMHQLAFNCNDKPSYDDYKEYCLTLISWADKHARGLPLPARITKDLYEKAAQAALCAPDYFKGKDLSKLLKMFLRAADDTTLRHHSFKFLVVLTQHLFKAAFTTANDAEFIHYFTEATHCLERLLTQLPNGQWPTANHYNVLGCAFEKAASLNLRKKEKFSKKAETYAEKAERLKSAQQSLVISKNGSTEDAHVSKELKEFHQFLPVWEKQINLLEVNIHRTDESEDILDEELETVVGDLSSMNTEERKSNPFIKRVYDLCNNPEAQDQLFRKFLQYVHRIAPAKRSFSRRSNLITPWKDSKEPLLQKELFKDLLALAFSKHHPTIDLLANTLEKINVESATEVLIPLLKEEFGIYPLGTSVAVISALSSKNTSAALELITKATKEDLLNEKLEALYKFLQAPEDKEALEKQVAGLRRLALATEETARLMTAKTDETKAGLLLIAAKHLTSRINILRRIKLPSPEEFEYTYDALKKALEHATAGQNTLSIKEELADCLTLWVDCLGDDSEKELLEKTYDTCMDLIRALEDTLHSLDEKYDVERKEIHQKLVNTFTSAARYYNASVHRKYPRAKTSDYHAIAQTFESAAKKCSQDTQIERCFLLYQSAHYYVKWVELLADDIAEEQILKASHCCLEAYRAVRAHDFTQLEHELLYLLASLDQQRKKLQSTLIPAKRSLLEVCKKIHETPCSKEPADLYTKASLCYRLARYQDDHKATYDELSQAAQAALDLLEECGHLKNGAKESVSLVIDGVKTTRSLSWIQSYTAKIILHTALYSPTVKEAISWLEKGLNGLHIKTDEEENEYIYLESLKGLLQKISNQKPTDMDTFVVSFQSPSLGRKDLKKSLKTPKGSPINSTNTSPILSKRVIMISEGETPYNSDEEAMNTLLEKHLLTLTKDTNDEFEEEVLYEF